MVACFTYRRSCGSSPTPTSEQVFSNRCQPSATNLWPRDTVRTAEINNIIKYMYLRRLRHAYHLIQYICTLHLRPLRHVYIPFIICLCLALLSSKIIRTSSSSSSSSTSSSSTTSRPTSFPRSYQDLFWSGSVSSS